MTLALGCGALLFLSVGACIGASGVQALFGGSAMTFDCTRATGECVLHRSLDERFDLASLQSAEVSCGEVHVGSGASSYETQCNLYVTTTSTRRSFAEDSADATSESEYRAAAEQINAFLHSDALTLHTSYTARQSWLSAVQSVIGGAVFLALGAVLVSAIRRRRRAPPPTA